MDSHLSPHHRDTIDRIFSHPSSANVEWREVLALLQSLGAADGASNGKFRITLGPEIRVFSAPQGKDIDMPMIVDLRRMLRGAGYEPAALGGPAVVG